METKLEVKTEERAIEIINNYLEANKVEFGRLTGGATKCSCGQTNSVNYIYDGLHLQVIVCESCGNDENINEDCLIINTF